MIPVGPASTHMTHPPPPGEMGFQAPSDAPVAHPLSSRITIQSHSRLVRIQPSLSCQERYTVQSLGSLNRRVTSAFSLQHSQPFTIRRQFILVMTANCTLMPWPGNDTARGMCPQLQGKGRKTLPSRCCALRDGGKTPH